MAKIIYGNHKINGEWKYCCKQELYDFSLYNLSGSFSEIIEFFQKEKEYYEKYLVEAYEEKAIYLGEKLPKTKNVIFSEIKLEYESYDYGSPSLTVYGLRELDEEEQKSRDLKLKETEANELKRKKEEYEKLKLEFEGQNG